MAQIFIFIYAFLTFLSLFLVVANTLIPCVTNDDCPEAIPPKYYKCMFKYSNSAIPCVAHANSAIPCVAHANSAIPCVAHGDCPNATSPEYYLCLNKIFIVFLSLIVLITSDNKLFCYNDDDCTSNLCRSPPYVRKCRLFLCYCEPKCEEK
ncbi:hypothetical protein P8452_64753 [Trifolium repens]|nr:hypothetical protein P8452_64753 [Trifolium repens]